MIFPCRPKINESNSGKEGMARNVSDASVPGASCWLAGGRLWDFGGPVRNLKGRLVPSVRGWYTVANTLKLTSLLR